MTPEMYYDSIDLQREYDALEAVIKFLAKKEKEQKKDDVDRPIDTLIPVWGRVL